MKELAFALSRIKWSTDVFKIDLLYIFQSYPV